jgi:hypothetical protein
LKWKWTKPETKGDALTVGLLLLAVLAAFLLFSKLQEVEREHTVLILESYPNELKSPVEFSFSVENHHGETKEYGYEVMFDGETMEEDSLTVEPGSSSLVTESLTVPNKYLERDSLLVEISLHNDGDYTVHFNLQEGVGS